MPAWMRMGAMKEYLDLVAHARIAGAEECEEIKYTKAAKTGAGETPEILRIILWWALKDVVRKWRKQDSCTRTQLAVQRLRGLLQQLSLATGL